MTRASGPAGVGPEVRVRNRETGALDREPIFSETLLRFLYETPWGRRLADSLAKQPAISHLYGWLQRAPWSRRRIPEFIRSLGIDATEAERLPEEYRSLDEFFCRRLQPGARPIDSDPNHLVCPADGRALAFRGVRDGPLSVKGARVRVCDLLGIASLSDRYRDGDALVVRLAPADCHRFHFPAAGVAGHARGVGRHLHSVHPIALRAGVASFLNKRAVTVLETGEFGELLLVEIGALGVGTIVQTYRAGPVRRGQEKGLFRFGGSTVVVLTPPGRVAFDEDLLVASEAGIETRVRTGWRVGRRA